MCILVKNRDGKFCRRRSGDGATDSCQLKPKKKRKKRLGTEGRRKKKKEGKKRKKKNGWTTNFFWWVFSSVFDLGFGYLFWVLRMGLGVEAQAFQLGLF